MLVRQLEDGDELATRNARDSAGRVCRIVSALEELGWPNVDDTLTCD